MHDFQRDAQWATSQNPGLRLTGDSSLHECFGCHFIPAAFLFFRGGRKVVPVLVHLQLVVPGPAPAGVVVLAHNIRCQMCLSQTAGLLQWLRSELDIFSCCPSSQCRARIEPVSIAAQSSATTFRHRSMFPVSYTRRHLFCRHSSLQHWSVRLALEWMTCFNQRSLPHLWSNVRRTGLFFSICKLVSTFSVTRCQQ